MADADQLPPPGLLEGAALFLDFDGTLVELAERPDLIRVPDGLPALLERLKQRLGGRLAIVTGRSIEDLERHLDCAGHVVAGSHGSELRFEGAAPLPLVPPASLEEAVREAAAFAEERGLLAEPKPSGIAIHFRSDPGAEADVGEYVEALAARTGLAVQKGNMVAELRAPGADKGEALRRIMREPPFAGARPLFMGDDLTDEDGFRAAAALGGGGILVGPPRETAARWRLPAVADAARWLEGAARG